MTSRRNTSMPSLQFPVKIWDRLIPLKLKKRRSFITNPIYKLLIPRFSKFWPSLSSNKTNRTCSWIQDWTMWRSCLLILQLSRSWSRTNSTNWSISLGLWMTVQLKYTHKIGNLSLSSLALSFLRRKSSQTVSLWSSTTPTKSPTLKRYSLSSWCDATSVKLSRRSKITNYQSINGAPTIILTTTVGMILPMKKEQSWSRDNTKLRNAVVLSFCCSFWRKICSERLSSLMRPCFWVLCICSMVTLTAKTQFWLNCSTILRISPSWLWSSWSKTSVTS